MGIMRQYRLYLGNTYNMYSGKVSNDSTDEPHPSCCLLKGRDGKYIPELCSDKACDLYRVFLACMKLPGSGITSKVEGQLREEGEGLIKHLSL